MKLRRSKKRNDSSWFSKLSKRALSHRVYIMGFEAFGNRAEKPRQICNHSVESLPYVVRAAVGPRMDVIGLLLVNMHT